MIPNHYGGFWLLGAAMLSGALSISRPRQTDADRLRRLDEAERAAINRALNPNVIAAEEKRQRKRARLKQLTS